MQRVVARESDTGEDYALLASAFGHLGQLDKVPAMIEKYNSITVPAFFDPLTVQEMGWWWYGDIYDYDETYRARLLDGLRKAGVPEGAGTGISRADYLRLITKRSGEYSVDGATKIDAAKAHVLLEGGEVRFVDVRATLEFKREHIPGAVSLSLPTVLSRESLAAVVDKDAAVAFYCHGKHCPFSAYASAKALAWGFSKVYYFAGGFPAWEAAGYPVARAPIQ
jgi:rhodanese-related sulfurtransferase